MNDTGARTRPAHWINEHDPFAAAWCRELAKAGHIPPCVVDERDIREVKGADLDGYAQCHFFGGIGGWPYALALAGVDPGEPLWTGSCPCQPFSSAGRQEGQDDPRHLWPEMFRLIRECRPPVVLGEQVEGAVRHGWLDGVFADLEGEGYACGAAVLGAHSVGAPHIRQRLFWVADAGQHRRDQQRGAARIEGGAGQRGHQPHDGGLAVGMGNADGRGCVRGEERDGLSPRGQPASQRADADRSGPALGSVADGVGHGLQGVAPAGPAPGTVVRGRRTGGRFWDAYDLVHCRDGKARRVEPGTFPLAHGVPARVGRLRGYGNAISPQAAAAFIVAWREATGRRSIG